MSDAPEREEPSPPRAGQRTELNKQARQQREAKALRDNLRRRKQQARQRQDPQPKPE